MTSKTIQKDEINNVFIAYLNASNTSIQHLQLWQTYNADSERAQLKQLKERSVTEIGPSKWWLDTIHAKRAQNVKVQNIQIVQEPLSEYLRIMLKHYLPKSESAGQESFFVDQKKAAKLISGLQDAWIFDSKTLMLMNYDDGGSVTSANVVANKRTVDGYASRYEKLRRTGTPLNEFLRTHRNEIEESTELYA